MNNDIITLFGGFLATRTQKNIRACRGILRLAIYDSGFQDKFSHGYMSYEDMIEVISTSLKKRLEVVLFEDVDLLLKDMMHFVIENQGFFTLIT